VGWLCWQPYNPSLLPLIFRSNCFLHSITSKPLSRDIMAGPTILDPQLPTQVIHQFPVPTWIENIAVRSNGDLLLTLLTSPELYLVKPSDPKEAILVHKFEAVSVVTGIIEAKDDVFYVAAGNYSLTTFQSEVGSYSIWEVDFHGFSKDSKASIKKIAHLPEAGLPNGLELLSKEDGTILVADSTVGVVWKVHVNDGKVEKLVDVEELKAPAPPALPLGANGIKIRDGYLYWSNTGLQLFSRVKIDGEGKTTGPVETLQRDLVIDDFVFDKKGNAWLTTHGLNTLLVVTATGEVVTAAGSIDQLTVAGGTACQFGRTSSDEHTLYFVTTGAMSAPVNGKEVEGGKVVAIDTSKFVH
jgi:sugar lactone lactonase YvrE